MKLQKGMALLEIIVALALLGTAGVMFLQGAVSSSKARIQADERASAKILAQSVMDTVKKAAYSSNYTATAPAGYPNYSVRVDAEPLESADIQKITVIVSHENNEILTLENYKVDRIGP